MANKANDKTIEYYNNAMSILKDQGYIRATELVKVFNGMSFYVIEKCFESLGEPLYDDKMSFQYHRKDNVLEFRSYKVYKLLNPLFNKWREEAKLTCLRNNSYQGNPNGMTVRG